MPLRGKVLNTEKNDLSKILANKEIRDIVTALGCGIGKDFDISKLRYDKIIIMTDGDVDGSHIRTLLLTFIFNHMRELIEQGHVYSAMPPLYRVVKGKEALYLLDDAELKEYKKKHGSNIIVQRFKGLSKTSPHPLFHFASGVAYCG